MCSNIRRCWHVAMMCGVLGAASSIAGVSFETDILPIFEGHCYGCHRAPHEGPETGKLKKPKGEFIMDALEQFKQGGLTGEPVIAGKPDESYLYELISLPKGDPDQMPPPKAMAASATAILRCA